MQNTRVANRKSGLRDERGAALITVLMVAIPLLMAGGSLILITSMSTANTADMAAETKAYYAAEAGAQQVLGVMRGNVAPNPLFATNPTGSIAPENMISFKKAATQSTSNVSGDTSNPRLSRWLSYDATYTDRVTLTSNYSPITGLAFSAQISDPDNSQTVTFSTSGGFTNYGGSISHQFNNSSNKATLTYVPQASTSITSSGTSTLGKFTISDVQGSGYTLSNEPFKLTITQTAPWATSFDINCTLNGSITSTSSFVTVTFPTLSNNLDGTVYTRSAATLNSNGATPLSVTVTSPQPQRLVAKINGYGPRAAQKQLQLLIARAAFDFTPVSAITLRSADDGSAASISVGSSAVYSYSGFDNAAGNNLPAIGVTNTADYNGLVGDSLPANQVMGSPSALDQLANSDLPSFLQSADNARAAVIALRTIATNAGRYYTTATPPSEFGSTTTPKITFVDGDATLPPAGGAGLLVVTGTLTMDGNAAFEGLVLVLGDGILIRHGGGNGSTLGSILIAKFNNSGNFLAPTLTTDGGGTSSIQYDSDWVRRALATPGPRVVAIGEF
ncbi:MAG TPA: hypothetical protein VE863_14400 [Pyrinomonadaceae bacterium]|jgi:hypothetical protein|nr:hypothetical protein [Pyrinomonadaceae bacterium]